jgi:hypothetical protein
MTYLVTFSGSAECGIRCAVTLVVPKSKSSFLGFIELARLRLCKMKSHQTGNQERKSKNTLLVCGDWLKRSCTAKECTVRGRISGDKRRSTIKLDYCLGTGT